MPTNQSKEKTEEIFMREKELLSQKAKHKFENLTEEERAEKIASLANLFARVSLEDFNSTKWVDITSYDTGISEGMLVEEMEFKEVTGAIFNRTEYPVYPTLDSYTRSWYDMSVEAFHKEIDRAKAVREEIKQKEKDGITVSDKEKDSKDPIGKNGHRIEAGKMHRARSKECEIITNETAERDIAIQKDMGVKGINFKISGHLQISNDGETRVYTKNIV